MAPTLYLSVELSHMHTHTHTLRCRYVLRYTLCFLLQLTFDKQLFTLFPFLVNTIRRQMCADIPTPPETSITGTGGTNHTRKRHGNPQEHRQLATWNVILGTKLSTQMVLSYHPWFPRKPWHRVTGQINWNCSQIKTAAIPLQVCIV